MGGVRSCAGRWKMCLCACQRGQEWHKHLLVLKGWGVQRHSARAWSQTLRPKVAAATLTNGQRGEMTALSVFLFFFPFSYYRWKDKPSWLGGGVITEQTNKAEKVAYWRAVSRRTGSGSLPLWWRAVFSGLRPPPTSQPKKSESHESAWEDTLAASL